MSAPLTIGDCTLYQGDSLDIVPRLGRVSHMIFDPAYEKIMHKAKAKAKARKLRQDGGAEIKGLDFAPIDEIRHHVVAFGEACDGWYIAFCAPEGVRPWADAINASPLKYKRCCHWVKPDAAPQFNGQGPAMGAECFVTAWAGKGFAMWNAGGKRGVYTHNTNASDRHGVHPTEKPWRLMAEILNDFTSPGDVILDPFMGSGSTGVACVKMGRKFIGIEIDPDYFQIACERIRQAHDLFAPVLDAPDVQMEVEFGDPPDLAGQDLATSQIASPRTGSWPDGHEKGDQ